MTEARDELHRLVEQLPEDKIAAAMSQLRRLDTADQPNTAWPPARFGAITAGRDDDSQRVDDILAEGFGR